MIFFVIGMTHFLYPAQSMSHTNKNTSSFLTKVQKHKTVLSFGLLTVAGLISPSLVQYFRIDIPHQKILSYAFPLSLASLFALSSKNELDKKDSSLKKYIVPILSLGISGAILYVKNNQPYGFCAENAYELISAQAIVLYFINNKFLKNSVKETDASTKGMNNELVGEASKEVKIESKAQEQLEEEERKDTLYDQTEELAKIPRVIEMPEEINLGYDNSRKNLNTIHAKLDLLKHNLSESADIDKDEKKIIFQEINNLRIFLKQYTCSLLGFTEKVFKDINEKLSIIEEKLNKKKLEQSNLEQEKEPSVTKEEMRELIVTEREEKSLVEATVEEELKIEEKEKEEAGDDFSEEDKTLIQSCCNNMAIPEFFNIYKKVFILINMRLLADNSISMILEFEQADEISNMNDLCEKINNFLGNYNLKQVKNKEQIMIIINNTRIWSEK